MELKILTKKSKKQKAKKQKKTIKTNMTPAFLLNLSNKQKKSPFQTEPKFIFVLAKASLALAVGMFIYMTYLAIKKKLVINQSKTFAAI